MNAFKSLLFIALAAFCGGAMSTASANLASAPVGMRKTTLKAKSDTIVAPAYTRPPVYEGTIASGDDELKSVKVDGSPGWAADRFLYKAGVQPDRYYVVFGAGPASVTNPLEGLVCDVVDGGADNTLQLSTGANLSTIPAGTKISVIPYWTLATLFPAEDERESFIASPNPGQRKTQILLPDISKKGVNRSAAETFFYFNKAWRKVANIKENCDDTPIRESSYFIFRNNMDVDLNLQLTGSVAMGKLMRKVDSEPERRHDVYMSTGRPIPVSLADLGLVESKAFVETTTMAKRMDQLLVFNNTTAGYNRSASTIYYYKDGWRQAGAGFNISFDADTIAPDAGFIIRKASKKDITSENSSNWTASPTYSNL